MVSEIKMYYQEWFFLDEKIFFILIVHVLSYRVIMIGIQKFKGHLFLVEINTFL